MARSKWKGPYIEKNLFTTLNFKSTNLNNEIITFSRKSFITPKFIGLSFKIYNGKTFIKLIITEDMVGYKLGEFVPTRKKFTFKNKKKKK